jgi:acyl-CoA thioesterase YciA
MAENGAVPAIRVMMMPRDTNGEGTIFGGVILSYMDQAGAIESRRHTRHKVVTVALDKVEFHQPVFVGDVLSVYTELKKVGRTSLTVKIRVEAERQHDPRELVQVTTAEFVYVALDDQRRPVAVVDAG